MYCSVDNNGLFFFFFFLVYVWFLGRPSVAARDYRVRSCTHMEVKFTAPQVWTPLIPTYFPPPPFTPLLFDISLHFSFFYFLYHFIFLDFFLIFCSLPQRTDGIKREHILLFHVPSQNAFWVHNMTLKLGCQRYTASKSD